jgi:2-polyprenyl-6-methoxyphenol hydroxylase-like FAD-dependent oxidoreductase
MTFIQKFRLHDGGSGCDARSVNTNRDIEVPVLIVGGSLVGLTVSGLLASHGVPSMLVERHQGTAIHPRAASFHQRTMEVFRSFGLQEAVEAAAGLEFVQNGAIMAVETLRGKELAYFQKAVNEGVEELSPAARLFITQIGLEPVLRARAQELGADHRYSTELVRFTQDNDAVHAVLRPRDGGPEQHVRARYLVAADGVHSSVREHLGIRMLGRGDFANCATIYFRADVKPMIGDRNLSVVYVNHPDLLGFFRFSITGDSGFLAVFSARGADGERNAGTAADLSAEKCAAYVRTALGAPGDLAIEIDDVQQWNASAGWAERFQDGRVLLAGDAAHVMPPTGGFGGNTGVADAHNLAWKLARVIKGTAGPGLLATYDTERRPASALVVEQAYTRYVTRVDPSLPQEGLAPAIDDAAIELGTVYESDAVIASAHADGPGSPLDDPRAPSGRLGARAPHIWVQRAGSDISVLDVMNESFALLAGPDGQEWCDLARESAAALGVELNVYRVSRDGDLVDVDGTFARAFAIEPDGAVIVRPDAIIAWRSDGQAGDRRAAIESVIERIRFDPGVQAVLA